MRLKSYFADTVEAAMALAARELGEDALLVYSREAAAETKYLGSYEVVFAAGEKGSVAAPPLSQGAVSQVGGSLVSAPLVAALEEPVEERQMQWASTALAELKDQIGNLRQNVASHRRCMEELLTATDQRAWRLLADWGSEPELLPGVTLAGRLLQADMDPEHVLDVIECTRDAVRASADQGAEASDASLWKRCLERELIGRRQCDARPGPAGDSKAIVLIGPPGAGRTTVAMQLTALAAGKGLEPRLIAFEPARLTAAQALRSYAAVLGAPFDLARRADHVAALVAGAEAGEFTIIDGPGLGPLADDAATQLTALCRQLTQLETWLVLPSTLRASDLRVLISRFTPYAPAKLVFSRTSEARHWGSVWSAAEWAGLPIGFFCDGPRVPEDLRPATGDALAGHLLSSPAAAGAAPHRRPEPPALGRTRAAARG